jgi:hypothetical protein
LVERVAAGGGAGLGGAGGAGTAGMGGAGAETAGGLDLGTQNQRGPSAIDAQ